MPSGVLRPEVKTFGGHCARAKENVANTVPATVISKNSFEVKRRTVRVIMGVDPFVGELNPATALGGLRMFL